jgi:predicted amidohydrolase YtcJ
MSGQPSSRAGDGPAPGLAWISHNTGGTSYTQEELNATVLAAHKAGWQIWTHANGDRIQDMIITAYEARAH